MHLGLYSYIRNWFVKKQKKQKNGITLPKYKLHVYKCNQHFNCNL